MSEQRGRHVAGPWIVETRVEENLTMAKKTKIQPAAVDAAAPCPSRGEAIMSAWRKAGGTGDTAACVADILAMIHVEYVISCGEARDEGDRYPGSLETPESVCEEALSAVEVWIEDERRTRGCE